MDISQAHIDSTIYLGDATLEFAERLAGSAPRWRCRPASTSAASTSAAGRTGRSTRCGRRRRRGRCSRTSAWAPSRPGRARPIRRGCAPPSASRSRGASPTPSRSRTRLSAPGPSAIRICSTSAARSRPRAGGRPAPHGKSRRPAAAPPRRRAACACSRTTQFFAVLGHLLGQLPDDRIPVIDGLSVQPAEDRARKPSPPPRPRPAAWRCSIMVGITPEAPTLRRRHFRAANRNWCTTSRSTGCAQARRELTTADGRDLDMVILGSPHFSVAEFRALAPLVEGQRTHPRVKFLVTSSRLMKERAEEAGVLAPIARVRRADHARHLHPGVADAATGDQDA